MHIHYIDSQDDYIQVLASFLIDKYHIEELEKIIVILPSPIFVKELQKRILSLSKKSAVILPEILTTVQYISQLYKNSCINIKTYQEQITFLASFLNQQKKININLCATLKMSKKLVTLFHYFQYDGITCQDLEKIQNTSQSDYWNKISEILLEAYKEWQAHYHSPDLDLVINNLNKLSDLIVIAGVIPSNKLEQALFQNIFEKKIGHIILPPLHDIKYLRNNDEHPVFIEIIEYLKKLNIKNTKINRLSRKNFTINTASLSFANFYNYNLNEKIFCQASSSSKSIIQYIETNDLYQEIKTVIQITKTYLEKNSSEKLNIICSSEYFAQLLTSQLNNHNIEHDNYFDISITNSSSINFMILISNLVSNNFTFSSFLAVIKNPIFVSDSCITEFEEIVLKTKPYNQDLRNYLLQLSKNGPESLKRWASSMLNVLKNIWKYSNQRTAAFYSMVIDVVKTADLLTGGKIWQSNDYKITSQGIDSIIKSAKALEKIDIYNFNQVFRELISSIRWTSDQSNCPQVYILNDETVPLFLTKCVIICEFSKNNWSNLTEQNPWLSNYMRDKLNLSIMSESNNAYNKKLYLIYLMLQREKVFLTHSKSYMGENSTVASPYLILKFLARQLDNLQVIESSAAFIEKEINYIDKTSSLVPAGILIKKEDFPTKIPATRIETLVRDPYSFYAKNILKLKTSPLTPEQSKHAEFGKFLHQLIHRYTILRNSDSITSQNKLACFLQLGKNMLENYSYNAFTKNIWSVKLQNVGSEFIIYDESKRNSQAQIFSEIYGEVELKINNQQLKITAVADRIELFPNGDLKIIDFKTGTLPTNKDIKRGIANQLIIENIIAAEGGFQNIPPSNNPKLIYIKFTNSKPFLEFKEIIIDELDLKSHKDGLIKLLEHFNQGEAMFCATPISDIAPKYNDYKHLSRKLY